ncbi:MAG: spore coat U domain-containing protein, partial [Betaproteobacteria bacterium]
MKCNLKLCACTALLALAGPAFGAASCTITSVPTLGFPNYDVFNAAPTVTSQIAKFKCTGLGSSDFTVGIGQSATSGTISGRQMAQSPGSGRLNYNIYKDGGYSNLWGDGTAGTTALLVTATGANTSVPIYGKIDPGQDAPVGNYSDTVV